MTFYPERQRRRTMRLPGYDYSALGAYFITICTHQRQRLFGRIVKGENQISPFGQIVEDFWWAVPTHFSHATLDEFIVMPNHVHGIVVIKSPVTQRNNCGQQNTLGHIMKPGTVSTIVRSFKSVTTRKINAVRSSPGSSVWQKNYYDHIIRDKRSYYHIQNYIRNNPLSWQKDKLRPK